MARVYVPCCDVFPNQKYSRTNPKKIRKKNASHAPSLESYFVFTIEIFSLVITSRSIIRMYSIIHSELSGTTIKIICCTAHSRRKYIRKALKVLGERLHPTLLPLAPAPAPPAKCSKATSVSRSQLMDDPLRLRGTATVFEAHEVSSAIKTR